MLLLNRKMSAKNAKAHPASMPNGLNSRKKKNPPALRRTPAG
jgi:hypothetical protein